MDQGGNYWTLFTPGIWKVLHAVFQIWVGKFEAGALDEDVQAADRVMREIELRAGTFNLRRGGIGARGLCRHPPRRQGELLMVIGTSDDLAFEHPIDRRGIDKRQGQDKKAAPQNINRRLDGGAAASSMVTAKGIMNGQNETASVPNADRKISAAMRNG